MKTHDKPAGELDAPVERELELKLEIDPAQADAILDHPALKGRVGKAKTTRSTYYDTKRQKLKNAGVTLRVRSVEDRIVQTIKSDGKSGAGLFDRWELETPLPSATPRLGDADELPEVLEDAAVRRGLKPMFETHVERRSGIIDWDGARIEVVLDEGQVIARKQRQPLAELELELIEGRREALFTLARELQSCASLRIGVISKSERGERMLDGKSGRAMKAEPVRIAAGASAADAFQTIAFSCLRHFRANEPLVLAARDVDALHQSRVALRRLRSSFSIFKPILADSEIDRFRSEFRDLASALGEARNLDVLLRRRGERLNSATREKLVTQRGQAYDAAIAALQSPTTQSLILDFAEWVATKRFAGNAGETNDLVLPFASETLGRFWKKVKRRGRLVAKLDDEGRHELRIAGKKLRYAGEFFASLYDGNEAAGRQTSFLQAIEGLQDKLGDLNDIATERELRSVMAAQGIELEILGEADEAQKKSRLIAEAGAAFDQLRKVGSYWKHA